MAAVIVGDPEELAPGVLDLDQPDLGVGMEAAVFEPSVVPAELEDNRGPGPDPPRDPLPPGIDGAFGGLVDDEGDIGLAAAPGVGP
jgi:hypothetical protein